MSRTLTKISTSGGGDVYSLVALYDKNGKDLSNPPKLVTKLSGSGGWVNISSLGLIAGHHYMIVPTVSENISMAYHNGTTPVWFMGGPLVGYYNGSSLDICTPKVGSYENEENATILAHCAIYDLGAGT